MTLAACSEMRILPQVKRSWPHRPTGSASKAGSFAADLAVWAEIVNGPPRRRRGGARE